MGIEANVTVRSIMASEFKAKCLKITDEIGEPLAITKNGGPSHSSILQ